MVIAEWQRAWRALRDDVELAWSQSLLSIHCALPHGLALWLDFSATPKDQHGMYFPWTVCDSPLAQAVEDRIIKAPIIVTREDDPQQPAQDPDHITRENVCEKYGYWVQAAVQRWQEHYQTYRKLGTRPVLFIMAEKNLFADAIGAYLWQTKEFGFKEAEVLVIHTDAESIDGQSRWGPPGRRQINAHIWSHYARAA